MDKQPLTFGIQLTIYKRNTVYKQVFFPINDDDLYDWYVYLYTELLEGDFKDNPYSHPERVVQRLNDASTVKLKYPTSAPALFGFEIDYFQLKPLYDVDLDKIAYNKAMDSIWAIFPHYSF